jgi:hypothetical protein
VPAKRLNPTGQTVHRRQGGKLLGKASQTPYHVPLDTLHPRWSFGVAIQTSFEVPRGVVMRTRIGARMHPADWMRLRNNGRTPMWTRHMAGVTEAERDRRRHGS